MSGPTARTVFVLLGLLALGGLGLLASQRQFGWVEGVGPDGRVVTFRGGATGERANGVLTVDVAGEGFRIELQLPALAEAAERVPAIVRVFDAHGTHAGRGTLDVQETGEFFSGTLEARVDDVELRGGLRVRSRPESLLNRVVTR
jgi:hypothetical protein